MTDQQPRQPSAAEVAMHEAITTLVYIGVSLAVSAAILKRDAVTRLWRRLRHRPLTPEQARLRRLTAELRRDLARIEHGDTPPPAARGLYEQAP
jgi:hypothetical protein